MAQRVIDLRGGKRPRPAPRPAYRAPERRPTLRSRRRKMRAVAFGALVIFFALVAYGVHYASYLPRFTIDEIVVQGGEKMPVSIVADYVNSLLNDGESHFISRRNVLLYPKAAIAAAIPRNFPRIESAVLSRASPLSTALAVTIAERKPFARWCEDLQNSNGCYYLDEQGFVFEDTSDLSETPSSSYRFAGGITDAHPIGSTFAPGHVPGILTLLKLLANAGFNPTGAVIQDEQDFYATLADGFFIKASYGEDAQQLVKNLQLVLSSDALRDQTKNLDYIDLRFGDRVYYKLKGKAESKT